MTRPPRKVHSNVIHNLGGIGYRVVGRDAVHWYLVVGRHGGKVYQVPDAKEKGRLWEQGALPVTYGETIKEFNARAKPEVRRSKEDVCQHVYRLYKGSRMKKCMDCGDVCFR